MFLSLIDVSCPSPMHYSRCCMALDMASFRGFTMASVISISTFYLFFFLVHEYSRSCSKGIFLWCRLLPTQVAVLLPGLAQQTGRSVLFGARSGNHRRVLCRMGTLQGALLVRSTAVFLRSCPYCDFSFALCSHILMNFLSISTPSLSQVDVQAGSTKSNIRDRNSS
jgi:hypothetical protein